MCLMGSNKELSNKDLNYITDSLAEMNDVLQNLDLLLISTKTETRGEKKKKRKNTTRRNFKTDLHDDKKKDN